MRDAATRPEPDLQRLQRRVLLLCWVAYALAYVARVNLSVAIPDLQTALQLDKAQVGLIGSLFFWVYGIGQLVNGTLGDRFSSRIFIAVGLGVAGLANLLFGLSSGLFLLLVFWSLNGFFQSMLWGPISKSLSVWFSHVQRGRVIVAISTSMVAGYLLAWGGGGLLVSLAGWRWAFLVPGAALLLFVPVWLRWKLDHPRHIGLDSPNPHAWEPVASDATGVLDGAAVPDATAATTAPSTPAKPLPLTAVIVKYRLWLVVVACLAQGTVKEGIGLWAPSFLSETLGIPLSDTLVVLLAIPLMNFAGILLAGWLNRAFGHREKSAAAVLFGIAFLSSIGLLLSGGSRPAATLVFLGLSSAAIYGVNTLLLGVLPLGFAKENKVSSVAGFLDFSSYLAAGFAAVLTGFLADRFGWNSVLFLWIGATALGAAAMFLDRRTPKEKTT
jgi:OPA family glycerol-3-phosphate transporter-like MFS transporter